MAHLNLMVNPTVFSIREVNFERSWKGFQQILFVAMASTLYCFSQNFMPISWPSPIEGCILDFLISLAFDNYRTFCTFSFQSKKTCFVSQCNSLLNFKTVLQPSNYRIHWECNYRSFALASFCKYPDVIVAQGHCVEILGCLEFVFLWKRGRYKKKYKKPLPQDVMLSLCLHTTLVDYGRVWKSLQEAKTQPQIIIGGKQTTTLQTNSHLRTYGGVRTELETEMGTEIGTEIATSFAQ